jgi:hypothetical protein
MLLLEHEIVALLEQLIHINYASRVQHARGVAHTQSRLVFDLLVAAVVDEFDAAIDSLHYSHHEFEDEPAPDHDLLLVQVGPERGLGPVFYQLHDTLVHLLDHCLLDASAYFVVLLDRFAEAGQVTRKDEDALLLAKEYLKAVRKKIQIFILEVAHIYRHDRNPGQVHAVADKGQKQLNAELLLLRIRIDIEEPASAIQLIDHKLIYPKVAERRGVLVHLGQEYMLRVKKVQRPQHEYLELALVVKELVKEVSESDRLG